MLSAIAKLSTSAAKQQSTAKGAKPADLPIEQPTRDVLVVNLNPPKVPGVTIRQSILLQANEVIR
jgi:putative ABC transport system substrate-binding protein